MSRAFHALEERWQSSTARIIRAIMLCLTLLGGVALIEIARLGSNDGPLESLPRVHLASIAWTVTLLLVFEIVEMVFALGESIANSVGRHLQVFALLLLRDAFAKLQLLPEPIEITASQFDVLAVMASDAVGAILLYLSAVVFFRLQRHFPITDSQVSYRRFVDAKKLIAVALLGILAILIGIEAISAIRGVYRHSIFDQFFTVLVFSDVLLAVISIAVSDKNAVVFRNFGFAFAAIMLRLSVASPDHYRAIIAVSAGGVALAISLVYNLARAPSHDAPAHGAPTAHPDHDESLTLP